MGSKTIGIAEKSQLISAFPRGQADSVIHYS